MVRECRPPAREPVSSWLGRRSTMAISTPANANSPANISPVGPAPAITTACSVIDTLPLRRPFYGRSRVLKQAPCAPYLWSERSGNPPLALSSAADQRHPREASDTPWAVIACDKREAFAQGNPYD